MLSKLTSILRDVFSDEGGSAANNEQHYQDAIAGLLCEVAGADHDVDERETAAKIHMLGHLLEIEPDQAKQFIDDAKKASRHSISLYEYTDKLRQLDHSKRFELIKAMWEVAYADDELDPHEEAVIRKTAELLYVDHQQFIRAKLEVKGS